LIAVASRYTVVRVPITTQTTPLNTRVDEADVQRDEGEAYAAKLRLAGVPVTTVRYDGIHHDFMMLTPLSKTNAARTASPEHSSPAACLGS
jgi:acetyl esterase/lipase